MNAAKLAIPVLFALGVANVEAQSATRDPHIGYVYPAGGRQGTTFRVTVGGQSLRGATDVHVTGDGVQASVLRHYPPFRNLSDEERGALAQKMRELLQDRWSKLARDGHLDATPPWGLLGKLGLNLRRAETEPASPATQPAELPAHPLLYDLDKKSLRELLHTMSGLRALRKGQRNAQIAETVLLEVTIDRAAALGDRELRVLTPQGLTNPMTFQVGAVPEICELEIGEARLAEFLPDEPPLALPVLLNGQILPGDIDHFRFRASAGQRLVIETQARRLIPYVADAVPGWFQATLTLHDADGSELAFVDDYRFSPDPVLFYEVPHDGVYDLEIRDSLYRGREDFIYRISVGRNPFITSIFPLGCCPGPGRFVAVKGWNLSAERLLLNAPVDTPDGVLRKPLGRGKTASNPVTYAVNALHATAESEPNDTTAEPQRVRLPRILDGRMDRPGDVDVFQFEGKAGAEIVAEVLARRLNSPLDSLLRLLDAQGAVLAWNDDHEQKEGYLHTEMGVLTHSADSYLRARLPADGNYCIQVTDAQGQGGDDCAYCLRIGPPQPGFELRMTPSSLNVRAGFAAPLRLYALRKDGFEGEIEVTVKDAPAGFVLTGARIPAGCDSVRATLNAPAKLAGPTPLELEGRATIEGAVITRPVVPAEDMMQAFLYRHLTPSQTLMVAVPGGRHLERPLAWADDAPARIPAGGVARVHVRLPPKLTERQVELELNQPPPGITLQRVTSDADGLTLELAADGNLAKVGPTENLIIEAFMKTERARKDGPAGGDAQRVSIGVLPALSAEVVRE